jgi:glutathione S-transferase
MSDQTPVLHQYQVSPYAAKVRRLCYYQGTPFTPRNYGLTELRAVRRISPSGKLPALQVGERIIVDSTDIVEYLDGLSDRQVIPRDERLRAMAHIIEDWADESLYFYDLTMRTWPHNVSLLADDLTLEESGLTKSFFHRLIPKAILKQAKGQGIGRKSTEEVCRDAERQFEAVETLLADSDFLLGDTLSSADIAVVCMCTVLDRAAEGREMMAKRPRLTAWRQRMDELTLPAGTPAEQRALV